MPRTLSPAAIRAALALESNTAFLVLVTLTDPTDGTEYRVVCNTENVTSRGEVFTACYFEFVMPPDDDEAPKGVSLSIDNVDLGLVSLLRKITVPIGCKIEVVLNISPDTVEYELTELLLREVEWDESTIQGKLISDDPLNLLYPAHIYEPRTFPSIF